MKWFDVAEYIEKYPDCQFYWFVGERSNGKTYSALRYCLDRWREEGSQYIYVRRMDQQISTANMKELFAGHKATGELDRLLGPQGFDGITYYSKSFYPYIVDKGKRVKAETPCGYARSISTWETSKGAPFPFVKTIAFDEFMTREAYFPNEPVKFQNLISSIVRERDDVKVIMLANTVSWNCPYFREYGMNNVAKMKPGTTQIYKAYTRSGKERKMLLHYCSPTGEKASDVYFAYQTDSGNLNKRGAVMITEGAWEVADWPRLPEDMSKYTYAEPMYVQSEEGYQIKLQPAISEDGYSCLFVYNGRSYPYIDDSGVNPMYRDRIIYTDKQYPYINCRFSLTKHKDDGTQFVLSCLKEGRTYYENNTVGENLRSYLMWSTRWTPILD